MHHLAAPVFGGGGRVAAKCPEGKCRGFLKMQALVASASGDGSAMHAKRQSAIMQHAGGQACGNERASVRVNFNRLCNVRKVRKRPVV